MEETTAKKPGGKREGQKYKSLLVWDILLKKTDENHALQLKDIKEHLAHYYVLTWNAQKNTTITYRLDRMKGVEVLNEPREGSTEFSKINMETYTQQHFGMFSGEKKRVSLRFTNNLLDTIVDRFGTGADVFYRPDGDRHFVVSTDIAISDQFFGWIAGFRKMAQIVSPPDVVADFQSFLSDISERYESE